VPIPHPLALPGRPRQRDACQPIPRSKFDQIKEVPTSHLRLIFRWAFHRLPVIAAVAVVLIVVLALPAGADTGAPTLTGVIDNLRNWLVGILATVATLFLTIGGLRYLTAGGDPGQVEKAKTALKSAAIGYALAILAPLLVSILASVVGG
jgi:hypothetical protein